jgi:hypothetical protein
MGDCHENGPPANGMNDFDADGYRLEVALAECDRLREENRRLRKQLGIVAIEQSAMPVTQGTITTKSSAEEKVRLFRNLFRGRDDIHAVRWEGRNGKTGYSPACRKVWDNSLQRYAVEPKEYFALTDQVIHHHLTGKLTCGIYPLLIDETCWFLAADFDKATWRDLRRDIPEVVYVMGNSVAIARKHYVREVTKEWMEKFWSLKPTP